MPDLSSESELQTTLESDLPSLPAGLTTALFLFGTCFHRHDEITRLEILINGEPHPVTAFGMPRLDLFQSLHPQLGAGEKWVPDHDTGSAEDPEVRCYRSGFWATVPVRVGSQPGEELIVKARARLENDSIAEAEVGRVKVTGPVLGQGTETGEERGKRGLIAVCMATFNPDMDLFRIQVSSLREQTETDWVCMVSDDCSRPDRFREIEAELDGDTRFVISRSERRLGFYRNFERALGMVPPDASLVALCDQDDRWYPEKLATLRDGLGRAQLIYSDQRLVNIDGDVLAETYWTARRNNHTNLISLLIANTVTGAASLMRREVVDRALPFPEVPGEQYHDHWLGLVAMTIGKVAYVDRPLYDYVQHGGAALGHAAANAGISGGRFRHWGSHLRPGRWRQLFSGWRSAYFRAYVRLEVLAQVLLVRCGDQAGRRKRRALRRFTRAEHSPIGFLWLGMRSLRGLFGHGETLGVERLLIEGILWRYLIAIRSRGVTRPAGSVYDTSMPPSEGRTSAPIHRDPATSHIQRMVEPLELSVSEHEPERVNLLIPTIDLKHLFGGYIAKFNLARKLAESGIRIRIVTVDKTPPLPPDWRQQVESYSGLAGAFSGLEVAFARNQDSPLPISPNDRFVATTWWTAHLARDAVAQTSRERFLYLIQEYEPFTFVMGSWAAMASQTYGFPHLALFSTELLRSYFSERGLGVFANGREAGQRDSTSFQNAITAVTSPSVAELDQRKTRRLLFYARPEPHAARNMFELGLLSLSTAIEQGIFGPEWEFFGIGAVDGRSRIDLPGSAHLDLLPRQNQGEYGELLGSHDVGLSLMFTPHPSLVPIEMASAGLLTVTNSFETKTASAMEAISPNLIATDPSIEGIVSGLRVAVDLVLDSRGRHEGSVVNWSSDWEDSFDQSKMREITDLLGRC